jgi:hypothetical protein
MEQAKYYDFVYQVDGEKLLNNPKKLFDSHGVYLFIDKPLKTIWIWAGLQSRLFHRYIGANWAGKLKVKKEFYGFKYEVIKEGREPIEFQYITSELKKGPEKYNFPGESRNKSTKNDIIKPTKLINSHKIQSNLPKSLQTSHSYLNRNTYSKINTIINEIKEIHSHIKYSVQHVDKRINQIEELLRNLYKT